MAISGIATPRSSGVNYVVEVDAFDVDQLLDHVMLAVSGPSLERFLSSDASDYYADEIEATFNEEGGVKMGFWPPLHDSTVRIREALGYPGHEPINIRTGKLFDYMMGPYDTQFGEDWAELEIPGDTSDPITRRKFETAQAGSNDNPLGYGPTSPRPVLGVRDMDVARLVELLNNHVVSAIIGNAIEAAF